VDKKYFYGFGKQKAVLKRDKCLSATFRAHSNKTCFDRTRKLVKKTCSPVRRGLTLTRFGQFITLILMKGKVKDYSPTIPNGFTNYYLIVGASAFHF
jgi:hypothetical protein